MVLRLIVLHTTEIFLRVQVDVSAGESKTVSFWRKNDLPKGEEKEMRKIEIANRIHQEAGIPQEQAARLLDSIVDLLKATLQKGEPIIIPNFGKFAVRSKSPRLGRNPSTGEAIMIPAHRVVTFNSSSLLKADMNPVQAKKPEAVAPTE